MKWRKSARSSSNGENCVEVADLPAAVAVRDSKHPHGPMPAFPKAVYARFADEVRQS